MYVKTWATLANTESKSASNLIHITTHAFLVLILDLAFLGITSSVFRIGRPATDTFHVLPVSSDHKVRGEMTMHGEASEKRYIFQ